MNKRKRSDAGGRHKPMRNIENIVRANQSQDHTNHPFRRPSMRVGKARWGNMESTEVGK